MKVLRHCPQVYSLRFEQTTVPIKLSAPGRQEICIKSDQATIVKNTQQSIESSLQQATDE